MKLKYTILLFGFIIAIVALGIYVKKSHEYFENAPPSDVPGASTNNPATSIAQPKDIQALLDSLNNFVASYMKTSIENRKKMPPEVQDNMLKTYMSYNELKKKAEEQLKNPTILLSEISKGRALYDSLNKAFANNPVKSSKPVPITTPKKNAIKPAPKPAPKSANEKITFAELKNLEFRIKKEIERITKLRTSSSNLIAKKTQLEKIHAEIVEMINKINRKTMKINEVPIYNSDAIKFLGMLQSSDTLGKLFTTMKENQATKEKKEIKATPQGKITVGSTGKELVTSLKNYPDMNQQLQKLLDNAKHLKWNVQVNFEFDPEIAQRQVYLKRLEEIEKKFTNLTINNSKISNEAYRLYLQELQVLETLILKDTKNRYPNKTDVKITDTTERFMPSLTNAVKPTSEQLENAQSVKFNSGMMENKNVKKSDYFFRNEYPEFATVNANIKNRASKASFDSTQVGGLDYKERAKNICRQINDSSLGNPEDFGCIMNQETVSYDYSWKGNFEMVCSRLGNTWGAWYPEMFGCPKK